MFIWESHIEMPSYLQDRLVKSMSVNDVNTLVTTYTDLKHFTKVDGLMEFYSNIIEKMMKDIGMFKRCKYGFEIWAQYYNNKTLGHEPHDHFYGTEIISFNHIIKPSNNKCFYFLNDNFEKNYAGKQDTGHFYVYPPWRVHGVDKVEEEDGERLIVAGNISLFEYITLDGNNLVNK